MLNEALIQKLVDEIYSEGYVGKEKEEFDMVQKHFDAFNTFRDAGVPVLNYGLFLAWANGLFPRALAPLEQ